MMSGLLKSLLEADLLIRSSLSECVNFLFWQIKANTRFDLGEQSVNVCFKSELALKPDDT